MLEDKNFLFLHIVLCSFVDRHRFDADPDPYFHFDAAPHANPIPGFTLVGKSKFFTYILSSPVNIVVSFLSIRIHNTGSVSVFYLLFGCTLRLRWD
jgi:hypothetical protein